MTRSTTPIVLRLLVLDDNLEGALGNLREGLEIYASRGDIEQERIGEKIVYTLPAAAAGLIPPVRLEVCTNRKDCIKSQHVVQAVNNDELGGPFDGILLDDNWGGLQFQGHQEILPALIRSRILDPKGRLQIAVFSMHFDGTLASDSRDAKVLGAFETNLPANWKGRVDTLEKSDFAGFAKWFLKVVRTRPPELVTIVISTKNSCEVLIDEKPIHIEKKKRYCVLGYLKLAAEGAASASPAEIALKIEEKLKDQHKQDPVWKQVKDLFNQDPVAGNLLSDDVRKTVNSLKKTIMPKLSASRQEELRELSEGKGGKKRNTPEFVRFFEVKID